MNSLLERLEPRLQRLVSQLSFAECGVREEDAQHQTLRCLAALETKAVENERLGLMRKIREHEQAGNLGEAMRLASELDRASAAGAVP